MPGLLLVYRHKTTLILKQMSNGECVSSSSVLIPTRGARVYPEPRRMSSRRSVWHNNGCLIARAVHLRRTHGENEIPAVMDGPGPAAI